jgi:hypothetical protein
MAKKTGRKAHKRVRKTHRRRNQKQQKQQKRGGGYSLQDASPYEASLAGSGPSKESFAQGQDFARYHAAQHGGVADYAQAFDVLSDSQMLASSMSDGYLKAISDVRGLHDDQPPSLGPTPASPGTTNGAPACGKMLGGRKRRRSVKKARKSQKKSRKSQKKQQRQQKQQKQGGGGALGYAPVGAPGLLLDNNRAYTQAGLNPEYFQGSSTEQLVADMRDRA